MKCARTEQEVRDNPKKAVAGMARARGRPVVGVGIVLRLEGPVEAYSQVGIGVAGNGGQSVERREEKTVRVRSLALRAGTKVNPPPRSRPLCISKLPLTEPKVSTMNESNSIGVV